ncbi:hypothetical protein KFU94_55295 [Chloroflexi bacterium TSY]|nr:hypothetical protein [Chloroflexi bacterium TSY]
MNMTSFAILYVFLLFGTLFLVACTDDQSAMPPPAGADKGQNTFLLFFTDN